MHLWAKFMLTLCLLSTTTAEPPESQKFCECVPIHQCDFRRKSDGPGNIDVRVDTSNCPNLLDICCSFDDLLLETRSPSLPSALPSCGQQYLPEPNFRITGDREAEYGEFPWMAALLNSEKNFICGGSLIHPLVVLTAGHCVANIKTKMLVQMGDWDSQARSEPLPVQNRAVSQIVLHEKYTPGSLFNDIALLILDSPVQLGGNVGTVCLPDANEDMEGRRCLVSGWGKNAFGGIGRQAAILKTVQLAVTPRCECQQSLRKTKLGQFFKLHISFMCAGGDEGRDSCEGDGGGPLVCPSKQNPSVFSQAGIVSWGVNCGQPIPAIYTNVALFRNWIDLQMLRLRLIS